YRTGQRSLRLCGWPALWSLMSQAVADRLLCGVGTNTFADCPQCLESSMNSGAVSFWWNWDYDMRIDHSHLPPQVVRKAKQTFTPMIWGTTMPKDYSFFHLGSDFVMGYNEPDQYGPACAGETTFGTFGCGEKDYRPATSAGFASLFDPVKAALAWQSLVAKLASVAKESGGSVRKIAAPAMAQAALPQDDCSKDPALPNATKFCRGWLKAFKAKALTLQCTSLVGKATNCWDVIEALPIHAYGRCLGSAQEIKDKLHSYHQVFLEDFQGTSGRTKKKLWLTEVTMGTNDADDLITFMEELMNPATGLQNRQIFGFVERISWFSEWSMGAFTLGGYKPRTYEAWSSSLFEPTTGRFTPHGARFVHYCRDSTGGSMAPPASPATAPAKVEPKGKAKPAPCSVGSVVPCPGGEGSCAGNQCCPDGSTCPSADAGFHGCTDSKTEDCTQMTAEVKLLMLAAGAHRFLGAFPADQDLDDL
ncbi:SLC8A1, partial [Symbiodinium pilosum]